MYLVWVVAGAAVLLVFGWLLGSVLIGWEKQRIGRAGRRLASERAADTSDSFANHMQSSGVPPEVSLPLYTVMSRALEVYGIYSFPVQANDDLRAVYGIGLPDDDNEFMDTDLREIARGVARQSGRRLTVVGEALDRQLAALRTVRDLGRWISSLPNADANA